MGKLIVVSQSRGKFEASNDGSLTYIGGEAHATSVTRETKFDEFKSEMAEMWSYDPNSLTIKYFLPNNKKTLITVSTDKDVQHMIDFHEESKLVDVYVLKNEELAVEVPPPAPPPPPRSRSRVSRNKARDNHVTRSRSRDNHVLEVEPPSISDEPGAGSLEPAAPINATPCASAYPDMEQANMLPEVEGTGTGHSKLLLSWANCITGLHQQFNNVQELRDALRQYSIAQGFKCKFKQNDSCRVTARCKAEGCPWRIHASKLSTTTLFRIKRLNETHTCGAGRGRLSRLQNSKKLVATIVKEKLKDSPNFRPKELANQIREEFGIELRYSQAWRGMETAREELLGSYKEAYNQLPWLCEKIVETNPGSVATLITKEDQSFHRLFVALHASIDGFQNGCRPLLFLDSMTLKSKYQSEMLTATALDGNDGVFPLAFAVVDVINVDNWHWFLLQLKSVLSSFEPITFVAERKMGFITMIFENSFLTFCLEHLAQELKNDLKGPHTDEVANVIVGHLNHAAQAATVEGFNKCMEKIKNISPEAHEWLWRSGPEHWANSYIRGARYNQFKSNIAQPFYSWVDNLPVLPVLQVVDTVRQKLMELIYTRRVESESWSTRLIPSVEDKLQKEILKAQSLKVSIQIALSPDTFEVHDCMGQVNVVNLVTFRCSCGLWQINGFPCHHAVVVIQHFNMNLYDYCARYFSVESFRMTYSKHINPVTTTDKPVYKETDPILVSPPPLRRVAGQPKPRRIRSRGKIIRPLHCSRCKGTGHNRATCPS